MVNRRLRRSMGCSQHSAGIWDNLLRGAALGVEGRVPAMATSAGGKAEQVGDSASLEGLARVGLIAYGVVYLLIGWLALQIAWGGSASKSADTSGALRTLADQPVGCRNPFMQLVGGTRGAARRGGRGGAHALEPC
jgi:hypothetical protein